MGAAAARVRSCWSPDGDMFWKISELIGWSQYTDRTHVIDYWCDCLGRPRPGEREQVSDAMQTLLDEWRDLEHRRESVLARIDEQARREQGGTNNVYEFGTPDSVKQSRFARAD